MARLVHNHHCYPQELSCQRYPHTECNGGIANPYLLDANEATWAFVAVYSVGCVKNLLVRELAALASIGR